ncbi:preprotein translocase subunit SecY [Candidatus Dojkabacteria bacterium]|nr:preprotein translocase subunit SecY [Candidatus Dojkabacteria bacterium]
MKAKSKIQKWILSFRSGNGPDILNKTLFILLVSVLFRILFAIPVPGVPINSLGELLSQYSLTEVLNITSSGALMNTTLIAIGLGPYINASVVIQLLTTIFPKFQELQKEGVSGRMKLSMYTRLLTLPLAVFQSVAIYLALKGDGIIMPLFPLELACLIAAFTGGSFLLMWLSELVTEDGFLNGSSYLIAAGILSDIPSRFISASGSVGTLVLILTIVGSLLWIGFVVFVTSAERRVVMKHAKIMTFNSKKVKDNHLPLKLNQAGVMPVIFATSFVSMPQLLVKVLSNVSWVQTTAWLSNAVSKIELFYTDASLEYYRQGLIALLIIVFSLVYTFVVFNPREVAENLQKQGAYIPGVRPGKDTTNYLIKVMLRLSVVGSIFLSLLAMFPFIVQEITSLFNENLIIPMFFSGTGILIVIGVAIDLFNKIRSMKTETYSITGI